MYDYLLVGQGIAGSLLSLELLNAGKSILVIADESRPSSSQVAGGMFNPVTGKHLAKTWMADELYPFLIKYYQELEDKLNTKFFHLTSVYRPYVNENQKNQFIKAIEKHDIAEYLDHQECNEPYNKFINNDLGGLLTKKAGWVDVPKLTDSVKKVLIDQSAYQNSVFDQNEVKFKTDGISYKGIEAKAIIYCEGYYATKNPIWSWLKFNPVKGETLLTEMLDYPITEIVNQNSWILPISGSKYRFGATYSWHELDFLPTEKGRETLIEKVDKYLSHPYKIIDQQAGVRPSTNDRRPIMGVHPLHKNAFIFNGLGTKGVSIAPYFAVEFCDFLCNQKELHSETTIERFYALY
ncbi:Glycine/D-amino acid oxidase [Spirosomataceae bacterium TFI 002]|nr:Glycine/D-amino acid oxidase [Spirosomataceae bacterium TFI 002]